MKNASNRYAEVGGWLLLLCAWLCVLQPLATFSLLNDFYKEGLSNLVLIDLVNLCLMVPLVIYGVVAGIKLWKMKTGAVTTAKLYFFVSIAYQVLVIGFYLYDMGLRDMLKFVAPMELVRMSLSLPASLGWYLYLQKSSRVQNTYNRDISGCSAETVVPGVERESDLATGSGSATIMEKKDRYNAGIIVRIIGIFLLFVFPVGTAVGVGLIVVGWRMGKTHVCSECGNLVHDSAVKICPACKVSFA